MPEHLWSLPIGMKKPHLPLSLLETMVIGLPCIVSDCTSAVEVVVDGVNGFMFKSNDVDSLVDRINDCETANVEQVPKMAQKCFAEHSVNTDKHVQKLTGVYEKEIKRTVPLKNNG